MKIYRLHDKVYRGEFALYIGTLDEFKDAIRKKEGYPDGKELPDSRGLTVKLRDETAIWMPSFSFDSTENIAVLAHELLHAVDVRLFQYCRMEWWNGWAESGCYYLEFLMNEFLSKLKKDFGK